MKRPPVLTPLGRFVLDLGILLALFSIAFVVAFHRS